MELTGELDGLLRAREHRAVLDRVSALERPSARASIYACRAAGSMGEWQEAITWAERGLAQQPDDDAAGWLHFLLGTALMWAGDPNRSLKSLQHFLFLADSTPSLQRLIPDGWFNLAFAFRFIHARESEVAAFRTAAERFARAGRHNQALLSRVEAAWSCLTAADLPEARLFLEAAEAGMQQHGDPNLEVYLGICRGLYHHLRDETVTARQFCLALVDRPDLTPGQSADLHWLLGCLARSDGAFEEARSFAETAYRTALEDWWPLQLQRIETLLDSLEEKTCGQ
jgi:tetratricopeptide (TPR) repeat protein